MIWIIIGMIIYTMLTLRHKSLKYELELIDLSWEWAWCLEETEWTDNIMEEDMTTEANIERWKELQVKRKGRLKYLVKEGDEYAEEMNNSIIFYWIVAVIMAGAVSLTVYAYGWYLGAIWGGIIQFLSGNPKATVIPSFISSIPKVTILIIPMVIGIIMKFKKISGLKCGLGVYEMLETHPEVASLLSWLDQGMMMGRRVFPSDDEEKKHEFDQNQSSDIYLNMKSESPSGNSLAWTGLRIMILSTTVIALITVVMWTAVKIRFLRDFIVEMGKLF